MIGGSIIGFTVLALLGAVPESLNTVYISYVPDFS